jgi:hypothetical protein
MHDGNLIVAPMIKETTQGWESHLLLKTGDSTERYQLFAKVYGETRAIASMRAELLARGFNRQGPAPIVSDIDNPPAA